MRAWTHDPDASCARPCWPTAKLTFASLSVCCSCSSFVDTVASLWLTRVPKKLTGTQRHSNCARTEVRANSQAKMSAIGGRRLYVAMLFLCTYLRSALVE